MVIECKIFVDFPVLSEGSQTLREGFDVFESDPMLV